MCCSNICTTSRRWMTTWLNWPQEPRLQVKYIHHRSSDTTSLHCEHCFTIPCGCDCRYPAVQGVRGNDADSAVGDHHGSRSPYAQACDDRGRGRGGGTLRDADGG